MKSLFLILLVIVLFSPLEYASAQVQNPNMRVDDLSFLRESLQTGETITPEGQLVAIIIEGLGTILIIVFIVIYAIKKGSEKNQNDMY